MQNRETKASQILKPQAYLKQLRVQIIPAKRKVQDRIDERHN